MNIISEARKFIVAVLGAVSVIVESGLLHGSALHWATIGSTVASALLVYMVPNQTPAQLVANVEAQAPSLVSAIIQAFEHPAVKAAVVQAVAAQKGGNVTYTPPVAVTGPQPAPPIL